MDRFLRHSDVLATDTAGEARPTAAVLVIILNFNGLADTLVCLESLRNQTSRPHVLVIDNGSRDDELGGIATRYPEIETMALPENLGWAGGNNVGLQLALERGFEQACLLNNDTVLDPTAIAEMLAAATQFAEPCLLHPTIAYFDGPTQWQLNPQPVSTSDLGPDLVEMDFAYGACLMLPASVVRCVGLLDERFFLQLEEADYFRRARALGIRSLCTRRARILHKESVSFGGRITDTKTYYQVRNTLLLTEKHSPTLRGFLGAARGLAWALRRQAQADKGSDGRGGEAGGERKGGWLRFLGWLLSAHPLARAARQGVRDYLRRRFGRRPAIHVVS